MPGCLPHFPPLHPLVKEERGDVREGGDTEDYIGFVGVGNFPFFFSLYACLASLCALNNGFPVSIAVVLLFALILIPCIL